jgi:hypothetical protein
MRSWSWSLVVACALSVAAWSASALVAQAPAPGACRHCQDRGVVPCSKHGKAWALEQPDQDVAFCSAVVECKACLGTLHVDCKQCQPAGGADDLAHRQQLAQQWLQERRKTIDALTAREPHQHLRTSHYDLAFTLKPATVGTEKLDSHVRMHLYGKRLEALRSAFLTTLELPDGDLPERMLVCMSEDARDHAVLGPRLTGMGSPNSVSLKLMGPTYVFSMHPERKSLPDDEAVHRNLVHNVTHLLLTQMKPALYLGNRKHGWIDEGVAHWFEDKLVGKCTNYCYEEVALLAGEGFKGGKWRPAIRRLVDAGDVVTFGALVQKQTDELKFSEHAFAFAYVDFLLATAGGAKFRDLLRLVKSGTATRDALTQATGLNLLTIDGVFSTWVKANYSLQPPR